MPKPTNKYDVKHLHNLQKLQQKIDDIYKAATKEAAAIGVSVPNFNEDKPFAFDDYPTTKKRIENLLKGFQKSVEACVVNGIDAEWELSNKKNDELAEQVFGRKVSKLTKEQRARYFSSNDSARQAFIARKENGLGLSDRVWRYTKEFKSEIEMGLDLGLREGQSADEMSRDLRQYLQHPDKLFRRVRDEHGMLHLSKQAAAFHPGRGVYRSSYMNARRLAATEGNIAYRTADNERWKEMDFVVGIEVHLSNNHTLKGRDGKPHPFTDICDELQGRYPKDFKFTGWHPNCRCYATSILKTDEEIAADTKKILNGEPVDGRSVNEVKDVPQGFKDWVLNNQERIGGAKSLPYFVKDNQRIVDNIINPTEELSALDIAKLRHEARTQAYVDNIRKQWYERRSIRKYGDRVLRYMSGISDVDTSSLENAIRSGNNKLILEEANKLKLVGKSILSLDKLDNPIEVARATSMSMAKTIHDNVVRTLGKMPTELSARKSKLEYEIGWMEKEGKRRYPDTWKYSQEAYKKELSIVQRKIDFNDVKDSVRDALSYSNTTRSARLKALATEMRALLSDPNASISELRAKADELNSKYQSLNTIRTSTTAGAKTAAEIKAELGTKCPKTIENLQDLIDKKEKSQGWTQEERSKFRAKMTELLENSDYGMNVPLRSDNGDNVVDKIFNSYFKAQQETRTGKGMVDVSARSDASKQLFGTNTKVARGDDYEKYGFLMDKDILKQASSGIADQYWSSGRGIQVRFNKKKVICTFTLGDSLFSGRIPSLTTDPRSTSSFDYNKGNVMSAPTSSAVDFTRKISGSYVELQYHGHLGLDCIESIYIPNKVLPDISSSTLRKMKSLKCKIYSDDGNGNLVEIK